MKRLIQQTLEEVQGNSRERILSQSDVEEFLAALKVAQKVAKYTQIDPKNIIVISNAGGVANSYKYPARTTEMSASANKDSPRIRIGRVFASKTPYGRDAYTEIHIDRFLLTYRDKMALCVLGLDTLTKKGEPRKGVLKLLHKELNFRSLAAKKKKIMRDVDALLSRWAVMEKAVKGFSDELEDGLF